MVIYYGVIMLLYHQKIGQWYYKNFRGPVGVTWIKSLACGVVWWPKHDGEIDFLVHLCSKFRVHHDSPSLAPLFYPGIGLPAHNLDIRDYWLQMHNPNGWTCSRCHQPPLVLLFKVYMVLSPDMVCKIELFQTMLKIFVSTEFSHF